MKQKLTMYSAETASVQERFEQFLSASTARGLSEKTLTTYRQHLHCISKHLDITTPLSLLHKSNLECMVSSIKQKDTVKETYSDAELVKLLEKPSSNCNFCEYRNWMIVQFLMNSGWRAATIRNVQTRDVDLDSKQVEG